MVDGAAQAALLHGQPCLRLSLSNGDSLTVLQQGAQVVSWVAGGQERLFLSPHSRWDGQSAVRGGVPICFPQFNQRGPLPKHGFARNVMWQPEPQQSSADGVRQVFFLRDSDRTRQWWPASFVATYTIDLQPDCLQLTLEVHNPEGPAWTFTGALHTYLAVGDVGQATLHGLGDQPEWDAVTDRHALGAHVIGFDGEFDRVYQAPEQPLVLQEGGQRLEIAQSSSFSQTVVWNPGASRAAELPDLLPQGQARMLCVEAAQVLSPVTLPAGARWQGWQRLRLL